GWGKIHIPEQELQTTSFWLSLPERATAGWPKERVEIGLAGLGNLLHGLAPLLLMCAPHDLGLAVEVRSPHTELPTIYLFDMTPGGIGFSERLFRSTNGGSMSTISRSRSSGGEPSIRCSSRTSGFAVRRRIGGRTSSSSTPRPRASRAAPGRTSS